MKQFSKWRDFFLVFATAICIFMVVTFIRADWIIFAALLFILVFGSWTFLGLWKSVEKKGIETGVDISKILGKDAKEALSFGDVGIIIYNDEFQAVWVSDYFKEHDIELLNKKLCNWMPQLKPLLDSKVDFVQAQVDGNDYEVVRKEGSQILFIKNITETANLKRRLVDESIVVGLVTLDNYQEYQSYENEEILSEINTHLRTPIVSWAKQMGIFIRRIRSDRFIVLMDSKIMEKLRKDNFSILQKVKDTASHMDISITLSMVFTCGTREFGSIDTILNDLQELVASRGGDQVAIRTSKGKIEFIGGNSEKNSVRSKVRVSIMTNTIEDLMKEARKVFVLGHKNTDYDCMGAALAVTNWAKALGKESFVVLKDVSRDKQLQETMDFYRSALYERHSFITPEEAYKLFDPEKDLVIMVDHGIPAISSGESLLEMAKKVVVIDHHRRGEGFVKTPVLTYVESQASSTCELVTEMIEASGVSVPVYEAEATVMYLGILVDTNRFRSHTSQRTFQAAGTLRLWGANSQVAETALMEEYDYFKMKNDLISEAQNYKGRFMIAPLKEPVSRTMISQVSDALLQIKGCQASFTIAENSSNGKVAISARSDGTFNVQKIMEKLSGGGHFAAAATELDTMSVQEAQVALQNALDEEEKEMERDQES